MRSLTIKSWKFGQPRCIVVIAALVFLVGVVLVPVKSTSSTSVATLSKDARLEAARGLVGRELYACRAAQFYQFKPNSPLGLPIGDREHFFPLLTPMRIVEVIPSVSSSVVQGLLLVVQPPGHEKLVFKADLPLTGTLQQGDKLLEQLVSGGYGGIMLKVPSSFTKDEIDSIRYNAVTKGMSEEEVTCTLGFPDSTNDYGNAGEQLVYLGGRELIYIDSETGRVTDIQHLEY